MSLAIISHINIREIRLVLQSQRKLPLSLFGWKSLADAPSFQQTSIIPKASR